VKHWLNLAEEDDGDEGGTIRMGDGRMEEVVLTMDEDDILM